MRITSRRSYGYSNFTELHSNLHSCFFQIAVTKNGKTMDKLSPWATYVTRPKDTVVYHQVTLCLVRESGPVELHNVQKRSLEACNEVWMGYI